MYNYDGKVFKSVMHSPNGETVEGSLFHYRQKDNVLTCSYASSNVVYGHLIALVADDGSLDIRYHQLNCYGQLMTGTCFSKPEVLPNGKIRLYEKWQWTSGDCSGEKVSLKNNKQLPFRSSNLIDKDSADKHFQLNFSKFQNTIL